LLQEALDLACEQLFDEINIKVMAEKDSVGWKRYNPLTEEERTMYNAMVSPPVNPHPFFSDEFEQATVTHLSSVGGTPFFCYPESTPHHAEGEVGDAPTHVPSGGWRLRWGLPCCIRKSPWRTLLSLSSPTGGGGCGRHRGGRSVSPCGWGGDVSLSTIEVTVLPAKGDTTAATTEGATVPIGDETELVTSTAPR
jgi:hypothetical protein